MIHNGLESRVGTTKAADDSSRRGCSRREASGGRLQDWSLCNRADKFGETLLIDVRADG